MKENKLVKIVTILIIIAICLISFIGIFAKDKENILPEYKFSMNLSGAKVARLVVSDKTKEVIYDEQGNISEDGKNEDGTLKEGYTKKDEKVNPDEILTNQNYELSKKIIEKRLKSSGVEDYILKQNNEDGSMTVEIAENDNADSVLANLMYLGKFEIQDADTKEVLIDNNDVKEAKAVYSSETSGTTVYLSIEFNKEGKKKFEEITKTYISTKDEEGNSTTKKISINLNDEELTQTYFAQTITNGILQLSVGSATTDTQTISQYIEQASQVAALIDSGKMPIQYALDTNEYVSTAINEQIKQIIIYAVVIAVVVGLLYLCVKYKTTGIYLSLSYIGYIALLLILLRYANVVISLESIAAAAIILIANYTFIKYILNRMKKESNITEILKQTYIRYTSILFPLLIIAVVFSFIRWTAISSIGMVIFWGLIVMIIYNYIITKCLLNNRK